MENRRAPPYRDSESFGWGTGATIGAGVIGVFGILSLWLGVFTTQQYERDIVTRYGAFLRVAQPGFNFKFPWVDGVETFDIRERKVDFIDQESFSRDEQPAKIDITVVVSPRIDKLQEIYNRFHTIENAIEVVVKPLVPAQLKSVYGNYSVSQAINDREKLNIDVAVAIQAALGKDSLFVIHQTPVKDIGLSPKYIETIESKMMAEVEVRRELQKLEREKVLADVVRTQADAEAYRVKAKGDAEASAISARSKALAENPRYIEMLQAEKWDGKLPTTVLPSTAIPLIGMQKN